LIRSCVYRAIMIASSVFITRTRTVLFSAEMTAALAALSDGSRRMPRNSRPSQMRLRMEGAFSPIPAVRTKEPKNFLAW